MLNSAIKHKNIYLNLKLPQETTPTTVHGLTRSAQNFRAPPESPFISLFSYTIFENLQVLQLCKNPFRLRDVKK